MKKESGGKKSLYEIALFMMVLCSLFLLIGLNLLLRADISETNSLLSTFQRIDTIKPEFWGNTSDDPNLCANIKTECDGDNCEQICHLEDDE